MHRLDYYSQEELGVILSRSAEILQIEVDQGGRDEMASRSRGTPRVANRLLRRVRDYAQVKADGAISQEIHAEEAWDVTQGAGVVVAGADAVPIMVIIPSCRWDWRTGLGR